MLCDVTRCSSQHLPPSQPSTTKCCCCSGSKCQGGHSTATAPQQRRDHHNYNSCSGPRAHFLMAAGGWRVGLIVTTQHGLWFNLLTHSSSHHKNGNKYYKYHRENVGGPLLLASSRPPRQMVLQFRSLCGLGGEERQRGRERKDWRRRFE